MNLDQKELDKISEWFNKSNLTSATIEYNSEGYYKVTMAREPMQVSYTKDSQHHSSYQEPPPTVIQNQTLPVQNTVETTNTNIQTITSPIVGTFYRSPGPDSPPFVQVGDRVQKGDTLCIIEAMKGMNELEAEFDLEIISVAIDNTQLVEYGQTLFEVKAL